MKFLVENELEKRHRKHKKTIKPGAIGSFIHPDGGNQVAIDTFNNSVDMGALSCDAMSEELNEDYAANKLMKLISIQYPVEKDDNIQLFTTPRGNYLVKVNGKSLLTLGKENFRESDIENLRLDGYFTDYDELRMNSDLDESVETYINKEDKVTKSKFLKEFRDYPVGTYIRLCAKGNINDISQYTYGKVKTKDNEWAAYSSFYGIQDSTCDDQHIIDLIDRKNIKNIGVKLPNQSQAINEDLKSDINTFIEDSRGYGDYNQLIDDVADEFNLSKKEAENYVWKYFYSEGHSVENSYNESYEDASYYTDIEILAQKQGRADRVQEKELKSKEDFIDTFDFNIYDDNEVDSEEKEAIYNLYKAAYNKERKFKDGRFFPQLEETFESDLSDNDVFLSEDYSKEEKKADFIKALKLCAAYDPNTLYIDNYSQKQAAEAKNREINTAFDKIMMKYNVKSTGVPAECTNLKSESDYINKLKQYIAENKKVMKESFDPYSIEYWNYDTDEIEVGIEYCENNSIDPHSLTPTDFENIVILANGYYPHDEGWKYTDAEILSALDYVLEKGMMLSSLTPENFEEIIKKANELDECAKMTNKEIKESLNKLDMWAIDNDATFYDLKTLYEAFINPNSPIDQKKKDKIQKALNDPTMNRDTEKLQDYIAGILARQDEALEETLEDEEEFDTFKISYPNYNKKFDYKKFGKYFDKDGKLLSEKSKEYFSELQESAKKIIVPKPYNKYFEVDTINTSEDDDYKYGDKIDGYDCHFLAYLIPKDEDGEIYPILTDDPDYPVCELVGGRLIPVDL